MNKNIYRTKNLNLASYLLASAKVNLLSIDKSNTHEIEFIFSHKDVCEQLETQYWQNTALINPKQLLYALNELKDQMFNRTI